MKESIAVHFSELLATNQQATLLASHGSSCYDNAVTESFFHTLKTELIYSENYQTRENAHRSLFNYIEIFYNRQCRHSSIGYYAPIKAKDNYQNIKKLNSLSEEVGE